MKDSIISDPFMSDDFVIDRLYNEWVEHKGVIVAVDYDNTLFDHHQKGYQFNKVIELIRECKAMGCKIVIFSVSKKERYPQMKAYLDHFNIPFDKINENIIYLHDKPHPRKIYWNILLDDRAGLSSAYHVLNETMQRIKNNDK